MAGPMFQFNGYFYYALYFFLIALFVAALSLAIGDRLPRTIAGVMTTGAAIAAGVVFFRPFQILPGNPGSLGLQRGIHQALAAAPSHRPRLLVFEHDDWPDVATVALELKRLGYDYRVIPWWGFMLGYDHSLTELGARPEDAASVWWLTRPAKGGIRLTDKLAIFTEPAPLSPAHGVILPLDGQNGSRYIVSGLSLGNKDSAATALPRVVFEFAPLPASQNVTLTFDAAAEIAPAPDHEAPAVQPAEIYFNGTAVGRAEAGARGKVSVTIPVSLWKARPRAKLELRFPLAVPHVDPAEPRAPWWSAWRLWSISVRSAGSAP
jgi:hypothetical protein